MYKFLMIIGCVFTINTNAQIPNATGSRITQQQALDVLNHHNKVRQEVGVPPLTWSTQLAAYAQAWADYLANSNNCQMRHRTNPGEEGKGYGENLFWGSSSTFYQPLDASTSWYGEKKLYRYQALNNNNWYKAGHYTQMVWRDTKQVGVGVAVCPNGGLMVVANYYPAGNVITQYPY